MEESYRKTTLDNGLRVVTEQMNHGRAVSIGIWVLAGSRNESKKQNGISHLLEHMVFKGTHSRNAYDIAVSLESLGGHLNAFTDREVTCYYALVLDENMPEAIDVLSDIVQYGVLNEEDLESEKHIVFEEIKNLEDTPEDYLHDYFLTTVFDSHPLGHSVLGTYESIQALKRIDLVDYHRRFYAPNNLIIAAAGHLEHDRVVDLVNSSIQIPVHRTNSKVSSIRWGEKTSHRIQANIQQSHICTGVSAFSFKDPKKYPLVVLNNLLGGGMSSRLFQNLREKRGLAYAVYSFLELWSDTGLMGIYAGTSIEREKEVLNLIDQELESLCNQPIPIEELERMKTQLTRNLLLTMEDCTTRMNRIAKREIYLEPYQSMDDIIKRITVVNQDEILSIARDLFDDKARYTTVFAPMNA